MNLNFIDNSLSIKPCNADACFKYLRNGSIDILFSRLPMINTNDDDGSIIPLEQKGNNR